MLANFTEETCTGTGATQALAGATTGNIVFSESFADGDLVWYIIEDSGGTIKVAGLGTYVSATDDITRNDTWNWNGTVIDDNPSTNITLSGGTHTIRCGVIDDNFYGLTQNIASADASTIAYLPDNVVSQSVTAFQNANRMHLAPALFYRPVTITNMIMEVTTSVTTSNVRQGIYSCGAGGLPETLLRETGDISSAVATTGTKTNALTSPVTLAAGAYWFATVTSSGTLKHLNVTNQADCLHSPVGIDSSGVAPFFYENSVTGALPATIGTLTSDTLYKVPMGWS